MMIQDVLFPICMFASLCSGFPATDNVFSLHYALEKAHPDLARGDTLRILEILEANSAIFPSASYPVYSSTFRQLTEKRRVRINRTRRKQISLHGFMAFRTFPPIASKSSHTVHRPDNRWRKRPRQLWGNLRPAFYLCHKSKYLAAYYRTLTMDNHR